MIFPITIPEPTTVAGKIFSAGIHIIISLISQILDNFAIFAEGLIKLLKFVVIQIITLIGLAILSVSFSQMLVKAKQILM